MKKNTYFHTLLLLFAAVLVRAQELKTMDHNIYGVWKKIEQQRIANNGNWVAYSTLPNTEGNAQLSVWNAATQTTQNFDRSSEFAFSEDSRFLAFRIRPSLDSLKAKRRKKVKDEDLPKDTLGVLNLESGEVRKFPNLKSYQMPQKWSGFLAFQLEILPKKKDEVKKDTTQKEPPKKEKPETKESGTRLVLLNLESGKLDTFLFVSDYAAAVRAKKIVFSTTGIDSARLPSVVVFDATNQPTTKTIFHKKGKIKGISIDERGEQVSFLADLDTTQARVRPFDLFFWQQKMDSAKRILTANQNLKHLKNVNLSENYRPQFSEDGKRLFAGMATQPILNDTTLLPEEIVSVEVWHYQEPILHTQQKVQLEQERKKTYEITFQTADILGGGQIQPQTIAAPDLPNVRIGRNANVAVGLDDRAYRLESTWTGTRLQDVYTVNLTNGERTLVTRALRGFPFLSPDSKFIIWYNEAKKAWESYQISTQKIVQISGDETKYYDEDFDMPDLPNPYGSAFFMKNDEFLVVYDRFDLWKLDLTAKTKPARLTRGRETQTEHRYIQLDNEERFVEPNRKLLLRAVNDVTKAEHYAELDLSNAQMRIVRPSAPVSLSAAPRKAQKAETLIFAQQNFQTFPDILWTNDGFKTEKRVSNVNPQQAEYGWGSIELVNWVDANGNTLSGMLVKPAGFDSTKKYPMIVNFYEKSSDQLHNYRTLEAGRSQINYSYYANRGYLIFNPDIPYREGYPGESCLSALVSGVTKLVERGFVDRARIGVQGHSWGGYQVAYLITKTNMFKCAESGAPVVNMISAYNGIRWESGLLRQFQYEHSQSRIGGDLWRYPMRYFENSPIFSMDKVQTPVLILHNDRDGAVPWYQGIEFFGALRRLGKPAWLLNYNEEPHWPVKLQNRMDFQLRMQQFFDFYLKDAPMPRWMDRGVPAIEKGILQGLENK